MHGVSGIPAYIAEVSRNQHLPELDAFAKLLANHGVRSYLEIGGKYGCSFFRVMSALATGSRGLVVDLPTPGSDTEHALEECVRDLRRANYDARVLLGDSIDPGTIARVRALAPFDAVFIDANHTLPYVRQDWVNYGPMARIVAFHDIAWVEGNNPARKGKPIEVSQFWESIRDSYTNGEIKMDPSRRSNGIGVIWRDL